jgi:glycosyltransferase involved in cell wall biosynthesis
MPCHDGLRASTPFTLRILSCFAHVDRWSVIEVHRMPKHTVSVVIPAYNASAFICETLESVFAQTRLPGEVVVVDDASTDDTVAVVRKAAENTSLPVRLIRRQTNSGTPVVPTNEGIQAARGDTVALLDHDDLMLPERLATVGGVLEENPQAEIALSDYQSFSANGTIARTDARCYGDLAFSLLGVDEQPWAVIAPAAAATAFIVAPGMPGGCSNLVFRKSIWARVRGFRVRAGECSDYDFLMRAIAGPLVWVDSKLFLKRVHSTNLWKASATTLVQTLRAQRRCTASFAGSPALRLLVARLACFHARWLRWEENYRASLACAVELLRLGWLREAMTEATKTSLACCRDWRSCRGSGDLLTRKQTEQYGALRDGIIAGWRDQTRGDVREEWVRQRASPVTDVVPPCQSP